MVNYNTAYSKATHKYFFKPFNNKINKKKYNLEIWKHNICHINIIMIKDIIILEITKEKKRLSKDIVSITTLIEKVWAFSFADFAKRYIWAMSKYKRQVN